ncbi:DUF4240 domain-containing protein [Streptomyces sp. NE06-03C]|uniref:DUF4240 domain-containing protein n=1 Tax=unclassified Streptomyces TaxID=2593676 RepID=UPI0029B41157|nr:DUF4240 domain-containing protein [Streptomyces sp. NE06-03C]MDX2916474.1 DUF4240 domain-containing protein [Streptomyces sp. NE06-03C]
MDSNEWWGLVERARETAGGRADDRDAPDDPLPGALTDVLAALEPERIVDFAVTAVHVTDSAYRRPLWNAAYLIEGGCGDDGFMDFRDGLALLGRETFTRAVADPDSLAALPVVVRMGRGERGWIGYESLSAPVTEAYRRVRGETDSLDAAVEAALCGRIRPAAPAGESWDAEDDEANRRHLPRLAALFLD